MRSKNPKDYLWFAVDVPSLEQAKRLVEPLIDLVPNMKIGLELITAAGPAAVKYLRNLGVNVWYDGKFASDTPTTIGATVRILANLDVAMFTIDPSSGALSLQAAVRNRGTVKVLATTVPTHIGHNDLVHIGYPTARAENISRLVELKAEFACDAGVNGIVCSPRELTQVNGNPRLARLEKYTAGVRLELAGAHEHKRYQTVFQAIQSGATGIAIGRPIANPPPGTSRRDVILRIHEQIAEALAMPAVSASEAAA